MKLIPKHNPISFINILLLLPWGNMLSLFTVLRPNQMDYWSRNDRLSKTDNLITAAWKPSLSNPDCTLLYFFCTKEYMKNDFKLRNSCKNTFLKNPQETASDLNFLASQIPRWEIPHALLLFITRMDSGGINTHTPDDTHSTAANILNAWTRKHARFSRRFFPSDP